MTFRVQGSKFFYDNRQVGYMAMGWLCKRISKDRHYLRREPGIGLNRAMLDHARKQKPFGVKVWVESEASVVPELLLCPWDVIEGYRNNPSYALEYEESQVLVPEAEWTLAPPDSTDVAESFESTVSAWWEAIENPEAVIDFSEQIEYHNQQIESALAHGGDIQTVPEQVLRAAETGGLVDTMKEAVAILQEPEMSDPIDDLMRAVERAYSEADDLSASESLGASARWYCREASTSLKVARRALLKALRAEKREART